MKLYTNMKPNANIRRAHVKTIVNLYSLFIHYSLTDTREDIGWVAPHSGCNNTECCQQLPIRTAPFRLCTAVLWGFVLLKNIQPFSLPTYTSWCGHRVWEVRLIQLKSIYSYSLSSQVCLKGLCREKMRTFPDLSNHSHSYNKVKCCNTWWNKWNTKQQTKHRTQ